MSDLSAKPRHGGFGTSSICEVQRRGNVRLFLSRQVLVSAMKRSFQALQSLEVTNFTVSDTTHVGWVLNLSVYVPDLPLLLLLSGSTQLDS